MSTSVKIRWFGNQFLSKLEKEQELRMRTACEALKSEIVRSISVPVSGGRSDGRGRFAGISAGRSKPGEPPRADTGNLRRSIFTDVKRDGQRLVGTVGTAVKYAVHLEFGTSRMAPRPFFRPAMAKMKQTIARIFSRRLPNRAA